MNFEDYLEKVKEKKSMSKISNLKRDLKRKPQNFQPDQDEDIRSPLNLPEYIRNAESIDMKFVEGYLIEVVKRNKISVSVARMISDWYVSKTTLQGGLRESNDLDVSYEDLEVLLSRMDKVQVGTVEINES